MSHYRSNCRTVKPLGHRYCIHPYTGVGVVVTIIQMTEINRSRDEFSIKMLSIGFEAMHKYVSFLTLEFTLITSRLYHEEKQKILNLTISLHVQ